MADQRRDGQGGALVQEGADTTPAAADQHTLTHDSIIADQSEGLILASFGTWETSMNLCEADAGWLEFM